MKDPTGAEQLADNPEPRRLVSLITQRSLSMGIGGRIETVNRDLAQFQGRHFRR